MSDTDFQLSLLRFVYDQLGFETPDRSDVDDPFEQISTDFTREVDVRGGNQTEYEAIAVRVFGSEQSVLSEGQIREYDRNIKQHLSSINEARQDPIRLRYYQYLALFFTEFTLDQLSTDKRRFVEAYNQFIKREFKTLERNPLTIQDPSEFNKLAYWMATGSGKTFILHFNFLQYQYHFGTEFSNAVLIAPNDRVADQHLEELKTNGVPCKKLNPDQTPDDVVLEVTSISKLGREKGDEKFDVSTLGSDNVVFVDEGHKGLSSLNSSSNTSWTALRDDLSKDGLAFEYSATFASSLQDEQGYQEYSKSILFDYSYGRFHSDRYGKDFDIINVDPGDQEEYVDEQQQEWLFANLLTFYEKIRIYQENPGLVEDYNIEKPLSLFAGSSVKAIQRGGKSDVQTVVEFLDDVLHNENNWVDDVLEKIYNQEGIFGGRGLFTQKFDYLHDNPLSIQETYNDLLERLFNSTPNSNNLQLHRLKNGEGEIGLTTADTEEYFGTITVGDSGKFIDHVQEETSLDVDELETFTGSLFKKVDEPNSPVNFLIGSRKFAEGWDSVRPATMGLLNIGQSKGPVVVQMFGRGVRVNGTDLDGKRAEVKTLRGPTRRKVTRLETLDVFGVRANYIEEFKNHLESERVNFDTPKTTTVSVPVTRDMPDTDLYVPSKETNFSQDDISIISLSEAIERFEGKDSRSIEPSIDLRITGSRLTHSSNQGLQEVDYEEDDNYVDIAQNLTFRGDPLEIDVLDWERIWSDVISYKREQEYGELVIDREGVRRAIDEAHYELRMDSERLELGSIENLSQVEALCVRVLNHLIDKIYEQMVSQAERESTTLVQLTDGWLDEHTPSKYEVEVDIEDGQSEELISELEGIGSGSTISRDLEQLLRFTNQLYKPVFVSTESVQTGVSSLLANIRPEGIDVESEEKFLDQLEGEIEHSDGVLSGRDVVIMRNQSRTGIGFESGGNYYPDFVVWVSGKETQHVVFIDPKGLGLNTSDTEAKIEFGDTIRELSQDATTEFDPDVELHSYIVTDTPKQDVNNEWGTYLNDNYDGDYHNANIYFIGDEGVNGVFEDVFTTD